ncbi:hypothetical protein GCM10027344_17460 [Spelaeicoccus albus]
MSIVTAERQRSLSDTGSVAAWANIVGPACRRITHWPHGRHEFMKIPRIGALVRQIRRTVNWLLGGFLPAPLSSRALLATAGVAAVVLLAWGDTIAGLVVGLVLSAGVWFSEAVDAVGKSNDSIARHSPLSMSYAVLLCLGFGGLYAQRASSGASLEWVCMGLLGLCGWLVNAQPRFLDVKQIETAHVPNVPRPSDRPRLSVRGLIRVLWVSVAVAGILAATEVTPLWVCIPVLITVVIVGANLFGAWRYAYSRRYGVIRAVNALKPEFVIPTGGGTPLQIEMWERYLRTLGKPYLILPTRPIALKRLAATIDAPIVRPAGRSISEAQAVTPSSVRVAFFVQNSSDNDLFIANKQLTSVWLHHGDSDKPVTYTKRNKKYDHLFVAGQAAIDRYKDHGVDIPDDKFHIIGRPQTSTINHDTTRISSKATPQVLYAPTWRGETTRFSSLPRGMEIVSALLERGASVIFRPHPASQYYWYHRELVSEINALLEADHLKTGRKHMWGEISAASQMPFDRAANLSDAMVSDVSGVVTDYMQSGKPYAIVSKDLPADQFRREYPTAQAAYIIDNDPDTLSTALDEMLGDDPLSEFRDSRRQYFLGEYEGVKAVERFLGESSKLMI